MTKDVDPHDETRAGPPVETTPPGTMQAGRTIAGYELRDILGEGGMGVVWRAHDPKLDREVAFKVLKRGDAPVSLRQRLQREARAMARLKHENVLTVYDSGTEGERDFIAMELVDGCSLDVWLQRLPMPADIVKVMLAAGRGLAAAHRAGLVHRDFKPHNILRSNDGRVLVTDFGLARGLGDDSHAEGPLDLAATSAGGMDETMAASSSGAGKKMDSVLDSPLTQTGVLIGTPAYMAPEQFRGAPPDPRTDQFAFCVTAWQMLTGDRPYHGSSLEELRKAASQGIDANVRVTLLPAVRAALVRGLDPDPAKRWSSMDELLDVLDKATSPKRSTKAIAGMIFGGMLVFVILMLIAQRLVTDRVIAEERTCEAADKAFGDAWSPAVRATLWKDFTTREVGVTEAAFARVTDAFDAWRNSWMLAYDEACRADPDKLPRAKLNCLFSARDNVGAMSLVLRMGTQQMFESFDAHGILPNISVCNGPNPPSSPLIPAANRQRVLAVLARTFALRMQPDLDAAATQLVGEAQAIGWPPLAPMVMLAQGNELLRRGRTRDAREVYEHGVALAKSDMRLLASLRLGVLETSLSELKTLDTEIRDGDVPGEIAALVDAARSTAKSAGNDPLLVASVAMLEASALGARARWSYDKRLYQEALSAVQEARRLFTQAGDLRRAAHAAADEAYLYLQRADDRALDDAMFVTRSAEEILERANLPTLQRLDALQARIAFARGEYGEARARYARLVTAPAPTTEPAHAGIVVGPDGKPVGEATVIAWVGTMNGDPQNLVTDPRTIDGEIVQTASDGTFVIHAPKGAAIVAQRGVLRSAPIAIGAGKLALSLAGTNVVSGRVDGRNRGGVEVFAQFSVGDAIWRIRAPVHRDATYAIGGQPRGAAQLGATAAIDDGERTVLAIGRPPRIEWPHGRAVEVIVRGTLREGARVYVIAGRLRTALTTRGSADVITRAASSAATAEVHAIGATATPAGRELYRQGDQHAVIAGNRPGPTTACVAPDDKPQTPVTCVEVEITDGSVTDFPDGRWGTDTQAVLIELP